MGKEIGGKVYLHTTYESKLPPALLKKAKSALRQARPHFRYNVVSYEWGNGTITFTWSPDFDSAFEPRIERQARVRSNGDVRLFEYKTNPFIYHHKWLMVEPEYTGFDVSKSMKRSASYPKSNNRRSWGRQDGWSSVARTLNPADPEWDAVETLGQFGNISDGYAAEMMAQLASDALEYGLKEQAAMGWKFQSLELRNPPLAFYSAVRMAREWAATGKTPSDESLRHLRTSIGTTNFIIERQLGGMSEERMNQAMAAVELGVAARHVLNFLLAPYDTAPLERVLSRIAVSASFRSLVQGDSGPQGYNIASAWIDKRARYLYDAREFCGLRTPDLVQEGLCPLPWREENPSTREDEPHYEQELRYALALNQGKMPRDMLFQWALDSTGAALAESKKTAWINKHWAIQLDVGHAFVRGEANKRNLARSRDELRSIGNAASWKRSSSFSYPYFMMQAIMNTLHIGYTDAVLRDVVREAIEQARMAYASAVMGPSAAWQGSREEFDRGFARAADNFHLWQLDQLRCLREAWKAGGHRSGWLHQEGLHPIECAPFEGRTNNPGRRDPKYGKRQALPAASGQTAISRAKPSRPLRFMEERGLLPTNKPILDIGCGRGLDVAYLDAMGYSAVGIDPHNSPSGVACGPTLPRGTAEGSFGLVYSIYVLNVLPGWAPREAIIAQAVSKAAPGGLVVMAARSPADIQGSKSKKWKAHKDGYLTSTGSFQSGISAQALSSRMRSAGLSDVTVLSGEKKHTIVAGVKPMGRRKKNPSYLSWPVRGGASSNAAPPLPTPDELVIIEILDSYNYSSGDKSLRGLMRDSGFGRTHTTKVLHALGYQLHDVEGIGAKAAGLNFPDIDRPGIWYEMPVNVYEVINQAIDDILSRLPSLADDAAEAEYLKEMSRSRELRSRFYARYQDTIKAAIVKKYAKAFVADVRALKKSDRGMEPPVMLWQLATRGWRPYYWAFQHTKFWKDEIPGYGAGSRK